MPLFHDYGINWIHYLDVTIDKENRTVVINDEYRLHKYDDKNHPVTVGSFSAEKKNSRVYLETEPDVKLVYGIVTN